MNFQEIVTSIGKEANNCYDIDINGAFCDSRIVDKGSLFICKGAHFKLEYFEQAVNKGAVVALSDFKFELPEHNIPVLKVENIRKSQGIASKLAWGKPDEKLTIVGITGTKGKTTVAMMVKSVIEKCSNEKCGFIGTHEVFNGKQHLETKNTTPDSPDLFRYLNKMVENGCKYCVMEISSQALKYDRVIGLDIDIGAITNVGQDHISPIEHPSLKDYVDSKFKIASLSKKLVINKNLSLIREVQPYVEDNLKSVQLLSSVYVEEYEQTHQKLPLKMFGAVNQENARCALKIAQLCGFNEEESVSAICDVQVKGRMEISQSKDKKLVGVVDYAHTKESFEKFFCSIKQEFPKAFVITYFGCSANKALQRQVELPKVAGKYSDFVIVTSDEPYGEDPYDFAKNIAKNLQAGTNYVVEENRDVACDIAFEKAKEVLSSGKTEKVVVCALAKGCETVCPCSGGDIKIIPDVEHVPQKIKEYDEHM